MNILVVGGAGYIGATVSRQLLAAGHAVTVFDNLSHGYRAAVPGGASLVVGDVLDREALEVVFSAGRFEAVMHFAALIEAGESMRDPGLFFRNNVSGSINLIDAASAAGVERFVFSSSAGVYASKDRPLREEDPVDPANVYGETKLMIENVLKWYHRVRGMRYAALRYFNAAGAVVGHGEAHQPESHLIPLVLQVVLGQRDSIGIFGDDYPTPDGTCIRDYVYVGDLASAHLLALNGLADREVMVYNVGSGQGYSVKEVIDAAREITGHPIPAITMPRRPGDAARLVADSTRISEELGWEPLMPDLNAIMATAWGWHSEHPEGYGHV